MRKCRTPLNYPRRDPRHYRFPLPNAVWEYKLKPIEFMLLSYLCYHRTHSRNDEVASADAVAEGVHMTVNTVKKYLTSLLNRGLVIDGWTLTPTLQNASNKNFFTLPNEIFLLNLPPSAFMVYAYLLLVEDRRSHQCHPSYNTIAACTGLSKNTALKSVTTLVERSLIAVEPTSYFDERGMKWKGNNLYTILPISMATGEFHRQQLHQLEVDAERSRLHKRQAESHRRRPRTALCASSSAGTTPDTSAAMQGAVRPLSEGL